MRLDRRGNDVGFLKSGEVIYNMVPSRVASLSIFVLYIVALLCLLLLSRMHSVGVLLRLL